MRRGLPPLFLTLSTNSLVGHSIDADTNESDGFRRKWLALAEKGESEPPVFEMKL
jgi:hypothetical protein